ncbi:hypothetical protein [Flavihumibacter fluvii]|uniref:hypothetical protein n=1 Tax=Flavihumibacter fluvii TaxID=2838157 RepID=UPI001BDEB861|nr:hypothetical protein [Flavihumibacter fluvii]ULQ54480.1 hypothetical protein KJS93_09130 [Flavihumibacter fluvii]
MDILNNYLYQHKSISIPGLGTLHMDRMPARTDFVNRQILAPFYSFRFDQYFDAPDKDFFGYLANRKQVPDYEAMKWFNEFSLDLRTRIRNREDVIWQGLGSFHAGDNGEIYFKSDPAIGPKIQPVVAERIIRNNAQHQILVGDVERTTTEMPELLTETHVERESWWTYAIIIAAVALSICCYQLFKDKFHLSSFGSQRNIPTKSMEPTSR